MKGYYDFCVISGGREGLALSALLSARGWDVLLVIVKNSPLFFLLDELPLHRNFFNDFSAKLDGLDNFVRFFEEERTIEIVSKDFRIPVEPVDDFMKSYLGDCGYAFDEIEGVYRTSKRIISNTGYWHQKDLEVKPEKYAGFLSPQEGRSTYGILKEFVRFYRVNVIEEEDVPKISKGKIYGSSFEYRARNFITDLPPDLSLKLTGYANTSKLKPVKKSATLKVKFKRTFSSNIGRFLITGIPLNGRELLCGILCVSRDRQSCKGEIFLDLSADDSMTENFIEYVFSIYEPQIEKLSFDDRVYNGGEIDIFLKLLREKRITYCGPFSAYDYFAGYSFNKLLERF